MAEKKDSYITLVRDAKQKLRSKNKASEPKLTNLEQIVLVEKKLDRLRAQYEQFFLGVLAKEPQSLLIDFKRSLKEIHELPSQNSMDKFRVNNLDQRYQTILSYWERTLRAKEQGRYYRDIYKAKHQKNEE